MKNAVNMTKHANRIISAFLIVVFLIALTPALGFAVATHTSSRTVWENPFTQTTFHQDNQVNSTLYTFPKVIWNGSQYVDYIFNSSDMSAGIGSVYIKVCSDHTIFYDPYREEEIIGDEHWTVECYNQSTCSWETDSQVENIVLSSVNSSGIDFERTTTLASGATLDVLYRLEPGSQLKISAMFDPVQDGEYRLVWTLDKVSATKARWLDITENVATQVVNDTSCSWVQFANDNESKCLIEWPDAGFFNETIQRWETYFQKLELQREISDNDCRANVTFGDFKLASGQPIILDPTIATFNSTGALDGLVERYGPSYPPNTGTFVDTSGSSLIVGQAYAQQNGGYMIDRGYLSFDTSSIPAMAYNMSTTLKLKTSWLNTIVNFTVQVWGGKQPVYVGNLTILDGVQPIYGNSLTTSSWGTGKVKVATWGTSNYPANGIYINLTIPSNQINKTGRTQFELNSSRDGINAPQNNSVEDVAFYSGNSTGNEPKLEVSYNLDTITIGTSNPVTWFYRNASNSRAVIVLFGGDSLSSTSVYIRSIDFLDGPIFPEKEFGKVQFLDALVNNGFSIYTPSNDSTLDGYHTLYQNTSTWVQDLATYLMNNQTYKQVYLFGMSGGATVVGNEIQKDYASTFSAVVMNCAPVDWKPGDFGLTLTGQMWHTAATASKAKVPTFFPENTGDWAYNETLWYYQNETVQKEWLNWTGGHGTFFQPNSTSLGSCGDNDSVAVINWFNSAHPISGNGGTIQLVPYPANWSNWQCAQSNDGDSSYVSTGSSGPEGESAYDLYNASFLMIPSGATNVTVSVHVVVRSTSALHRASFSATINVTSIGYNQGGSFVPSTTYQDYNANFTISAGDGASLQIGVKINPGTSLIGGIHYYYDGYCTEVYAIITWT
jgi:hypothetical protein